MISRHFLLSRQYKKSKLSIRKQQNDWAEDLWAEWNEQPGQNKQNEHRQLKNSVYV